MQEASDRLRINRDTLRRLESGDSGIAVGTWLSALWLYNRLEDVVDVMDPAKDPVGMSLLRQGLANRPRLDDDF